MNKVDLGKLKEAEKNFMNILERENLERVNKLKVLRRKNLFTVGLLGIGVLSIYGYTIFSVKQEHFLDDFEVPKTTASQNN